MKRASIALLLLLSSLGPTVARGQAVSHPNQIVGTIEFTNTNPEILALLNTPTDVPSGADEGFYFAEIWATSIDVTPRLSANTTVIAATRTSMPYEITVEAGPTGGGIRYNAGAFVWLDYGAGSIWDRYAFAPVTTEPVEEEPAPNVVVDFRDCAGILDVRFQTASGAAFPVDGGSIHAYPEISPGSNSFAGEQARSLVTPGTHRELLAVRGDGSRYRVDAFPYVGTDIYDDQIRFLHQTVVEVGCDEIVEVAVPVPEADDLGTIVGWVDMLGEDENLFDGNTQMRAEEGPFRNWRLDTVEAIPSAGEFRLGNLLPSSATEPETGYRVWGMMNFRLGRRNQNFVTPALRGANGAVVVEAGETVDLGDTFVIVPGLVAGEIFLAGPPAGELGSCLEDLDRRDDLPAVDFAESVSRVESAGTEALGTGATRSAWPGLARARFEGELDPQPQVEAFEGDYELVLGGLAGENSVWRSPQTVLYFVDRATPGEPMSFQDSGLQIVDHDAPDLEIVPGETIDVPLRYCFGQLNVTFFSTEGVFFNPELRGTGAFAGVDFEGETAHYTVSLQRTLAKWRALGTPATFEDAADHGMVVACLPAGEYSFTPFVNAVNPGGGVTLTALPEIEVEIGCRQVKDVTLGLEVSLDPLAACSGQPTATLSGSAHSTGSLPVFVEEIFATVDSGPVVPFCTACGEDPSFSFAVPLAACGNEIRVTAEDELGDVSSTAAITRYDVTAPVLAGCEDLEIEAEPGAAGAEVDFEVAAADDCDAALEVACDPAPGFFFPAGVTGVTCTAADACGNEAGCTFDVHVVTNRPPVADAGPDAVVECTGAGGTPVILDGSGSSDPDGDALSYEWSWAAGGPAGGVQPTVSLPPGVHPVTLTVDDGHGESDSDEVVVSVADTTPPAIESAVADPDVLWPPNHRMRTVTVEVASADACDPATADCRITDVASDEPVDGHGDGDTAPDWEITGALTVDLRAERSGTGDGRIYTLEIACEDAAGNASTEQVAVAVPHDRRNRR